MGSPVFAAPLVLKEGELEKRSGGILHLWKRTRCTLTAQSLLYSSKPSRATKAIRLDSMSRLDCTEWRGERVYFSLVTASGKELNFRCSQASGWHAEITLALVAIQNRRAVEYLRTQKQQTPRRPHEGRVRSWAR